MLVSGVEIALEGVPLSELGVTSGDQAVIGAEMFAANGMRLSGVGLGGR